MAIGNKYKLYKANRSNSGSAMQLDIVPEKGAVFLETSRQVGERSFDWKNKIAMKLGVGDIGKLLAVLNGRSGGQKLYHEPGKGDYESSRGTRNTVLEFQSGEQYGYVARISQQSVGGEINNIVVPISDGEAEVIRVLLQRALELIHGL